MDPHRRRAAAAAVAIALTASAALAGAGAASAHTAPRPKRTGTAHAAAARSLAAHLMRLTRLPPGASEVAALPPGATVTDRNGSAPVPAGPDLVALHDFWVVPMAPATLVGWLGTHPPAGATDAGQGSASDHTTLEVTAVDVTWPAPSGIGLAGMAVSVGARPVGGDAMVRVDVGVTWYPTRPRGAQVPAGVHAVTIAVGRAGRLGHDGLPAMPSEAGSLLLGPLTLASPAGVAALVRVVDGLHVAMPGVTSCPADSGVDLWVEFRASASGRVLATAAVDTSGCETVGFAVGTTFEADLADGQAVVAAVQRTFGVTVPRTGPWDAAGSQLPP